MVKRNLKKVITKYVNDAHSNNNDFVKTNNINKLNFIPFSKVIQVILIFSLLTTINLFQFSNVFAQFTTTGRPDVFTNFGLGEAYMGNYTGAIELYDKALVMDPNFTNALTHKGYALYQLGNYTGAIELYDKALAIEPNDETAMEYKADLSHELGNLTSAMELYDKILVLDPSDIRVLSNKGYALYQSGNYTGAIELYDKALAIEPNDDKTLNNKGIALAKFNLINEMNKRQESINTTNLSEGTTRGLQIGAHLIKDAELFDAFEDSYSVNEHAGIYVIFNYNRSSNFYQLASTQNSIQSSDGKIGVDITFKMPVLPNSTIESIERINGLYDVRYIDTQPNYTKLISFSDSTITINNTDYSNLTIEIKKFNNKTGYLYMNGFKQ